MMEPLEVVHSTDEMIKCNKRIFELEFSCDATLYDIYCPPDKHDMPLWKILLGIYGKKKRPNKMPFKNKIILTLEGVKQSTSQQIGDLIKKALSNMEEKIKEYEDYGNPEIIY